MGLGLVAVLVNDISLEEEHSLTRIAGEVLVLFVAQVSGIFLEFLRRAAQLVVVRGPAEGAARFVVVIRRRQVPARVAVTVLRDLQVGLGIVRKAAAVDGPPVVLHMPGRGAKRGRKAENHLRASLVVPVERLIPVLRELVVAELAIENAVAHLNAFVVSLVSHPGLRIEVESHENGRGRSFGEFALVDAGTGVALLGGKQPDAVDQFTLDEIVHLLGRHLFLALDFLVFFGGRRRDELAVAVEVEEFEISIGAHRAELCLEGIPFRLADVGKL